MDNRENAMEGENLGWRFKTIVFIELLRRYKMQECDIYYFEDKTSKADFVACRGKTVIQIIQVSYDIANEKTLKREKKGLLAASKATGCKNLLFITDPEETTLTDNETTINVVPAYKCLTGRPASLIL